MMMEKKNELTRMKSALICVSVHHGNTDKIARVMADALEATMLRPDEATADVLSEFDLLGFGSGIYYGKHHKTLLSLVNSLPAVKNKKAFVFSTAGVSDRLVQRNQTKNHKTLLDKLTDKGFNIIGEFSCSGYMTWAYYRFLGGRNNDRPNKDDLQKAWEFAANLKLKTQE
jgi:flavodoxin